MDIIEDRKFGTLKKYFIRFTPQDRQSVKRMVIDMYPPYMKLIKELFPHAKMVLDKFHVVQLINRALNKTRIQVMKTHKDDYHKLKNYWKLLLIPKVNLNSTTYYDSNCFKCNMSNKEMVDQLLTIHPELRDSYTFYQSLLFAIQQKNPYLLRH